MKIPDRDGNATTWDFDPTGLTEEMIEEVWRYWESDQADVDPPAIYDLSLSVPFGWISVYRHTLRFCPLQHKYANLNDSPTRAYLFELTRHIAIHLGTNQAIYTVDSAFPESMLEESASQGHTIGQIIEQGYVQFGRPGPTWETRGPGFFFVDEWGK